MRCRGARRVMMAALDGEVSASERQAFQAHVDACAACRTEAATMRRLQTALDRLPAQADVPAGMQDSVMRRVRAIAAEEAEASSARGVRWMWWLPIPAAAALALLVAVRTGTPPPLDHPAPAEQLAASSRPADAGKPAPAPTAAPATNGAAAVRAAEEKAPAEVPALVAAEPDLFLDLPILENLEKLQHFEDIRTVDMDDDGRDGRG